MIIRTPLKIALISLLCFFAAQTIALAQSQEPTRHDQPPPLSETVTVAKIDFTLPEKETDAENALSSKFFNQPEESKFNNVTSDGWREKWQTFSSSLINKAQKSSLDAESLKRCIDALKQGRNLQTALIPAPVSYLPPFDESDEQQKAYEKKYAEEQKAFELAMKEREKNPEPYYNNNLAIIPVGAYLARHAKGECWIIVCKWEYASETPSADAAPRHLGHIMIWAMDTKTAAVVAYVTCD